ncbi:MAG: hypothetical protein QM723_10395 [Myxococcaceae bacterium]
MTISILPTLDVSVAMTDPSDTVKDGDTLQYFVGADCLHYQPFLVKIAKLSGSTLHFNIVSSKDGTVEDVAREINLKDERLGWGDPATDDALPATLKGGKPGQYALLFLGDKYVKDNQVQQQIGGTGKWPLAGSDTERVFLKYLPELKKLVDSDGARLSKNEYEAFNALYQAIHRS